MYILAPPLPLWSRSSELLPRLLSSVSSLSKTETTFRLYVFLSVDSLGDHEGNWADFSPSTELYEDPEPWYQQGPLVPIYLLRESRHLGISFLGLRPPVLVDNLEFYLVVDKLLAVRSRVSLNFRLFRKEVPSLACWPVREFSLVSAIWKVCIWCTFGSQSNTLGFQTVSLSGHASSQENLS